MYRTCTAFLRLAVAALLLASTPAFTAELFEVPPNVETRWFSFENPTGAKGAGGAENRRAKGHAHDRVEPGETKVLMDYQGSGRFLGAHIGVITHTDNVGWWCEGEVEK